MPVTVRPASHAAREWRSKDRSLSAEGLLRDACPKQFQTCKTIIQSSFNKFDSSSPIFPSKNGFVLGAISAYSNHHHLTLRPEDIWFAILTQLSLYVNAHAEELRTFFVAHEGKKELWIECLNRVDSWDFGLLAEEMSKLIAQNVLDPGLREWIMPQFTTTTQTDTIVASVLMMGALQKYFSYGFRTDCGIPSVTLLGVKEDWQTLLERLEKLLVLGNEPTQFYSLLKPVLTRFVKTFDDPESDDTKDFWSRIAHESRGSGSHRITGWIAAFSFWDQDGKSLYAPHGEPPTRYGLRLGETIYHTVEMSRIPAGWTSVPVKIDDNGNIYETTMVAGSVAVRVSTSGEPLDVTAHSYRPVGAGSQDDTPDPAVLQVGPDSLQPESGWWIFEKLDAEDDTKKEAALVSPHASFPCSMKSGAKGKLASGPGHLEKLFPFGKAEGAA
jgi:Domain of unknown function (DUF4419)